MARTKKAKSGLAKVVGKNIRFHRIRAGITQFLLAQELDLEVETISRYERGLITPSLIQIESICKIFGITADKLFLDDKNQDKEDSQTPKIELERNRVFMQSILAAVEVYNQSGRKKIMKPIGSRKRVR